MIKNCWLNINRECNLRCKWCYAKSSGYSKENEMNFDLAKEIIDLITDLRIPSITILGGEPTCSSKLEDIIIYAKERNRHVGMVTNGVNLANMDYAKKLVEIGLDSINISLKGFSKENYKKVTSFDKYNDVMQAIDNLIVLKIPFSTSIVLEQSNCREYIIAVKDLIKHGVKKILLSFCYNFDPLYDSNASVDISKDVVDVVKGFRESYDELNEITKGRFVLHQSLPACVWPSDFLTLLQERKQIKSSCQLLTKSGLIFDPHGKVIPCNALLDAPIGEIGKDFTNKDEFLAFWSSDRINKIYSKLAALPDLDCMKCKNLGQCGGGCISNWLNYSYDELKEKIGE